MDLAMYVSAVESMQNDSNGANSAKQSANVKDLADVVAMEAIEWASQQVSNANSRANGRNIAAYPGGNQLFSPSKALFSPPKPIPRNTSLFAGASPHLLSPSPSTEAAAQAQQNAYARSLSLPQPISDQFVNNISTWQSAYYASPNNRQATGAPFSGYAVPPPTAHTTPSSHATSSAPFISPSSKIASGHLGTSLSSGLLMSPSQQNPPRLSPHFVSPHSLVLLGESPYSSQRFGDVQLDAFNSFNKPNPMLSGESTNDQLGVGLNTGSSMCENTSLPGDVNGSSSHSQFGNLPFLMSSPSLKNSNNVTITLNISNQIYQQNGGEYDSHANTNSAFANSLRDEAACSAQQNGMSSMQPNASGLHANNALVGTQSSGIGSSRSAQVSRQNSYANMPSGTCNDVKVTTAEQRGVGRVMGHSKRPIPVPKLNKTDEFDDDFELPAGASDGDLTRVERKRYRNRVAARKCRARKMQRISELEERARALREEIAAIQERSRKADEQVQALRARINEHNVQGCTIDYQATDAIVAERDQNAANDRRESRFSGDSDLKPCVSRNGDRDQTLLNDAASSIVSYAHDAMSNASRSPDSVKSGAASFSEDAQADSLKQEDMKLLI